jgi:hypothetical protein
MQVGHELALLAENLYSVLTATDTLGFVRREFDAFVALRGSDLSHAIELGRTATRDDAVRLIAAA